jgi:hypothetical protein
VYYWDVYQKESQPRDRASALKNCILNIEAAEKAAANDSDPAGSARREHWKKMKEGAATAASAGFRVRYYEK